MRGERRVSVEKERVIWKNGVNGKRERQVSRERKRGVSGEREG